MTPHLDRLEAARQRLTAALEPARHDAAADAEAHVRTAELKLLRGGREDLGHRLGQAVDEGVTTAATRREIREIAQLLDAELAPGVDTPGFRRASDGGETL